MAYTEKYPVEISSSGYISMPPIRRTSNVSMVKNDSRYVYECPICEKIFYRKKRNSKLNPHKDKNGLACAGRRGTPIN